MPVCINTLLNMPEFIKRNVVVFVYTALILSVLLVFWQVRNFDFVNYDDDCYVYKNQYVLNGLTGDSIKWALTTVYAHFWHPLTWLSLMINSQLFGPGPGSFHLVNVFLHLANTLLLFAVLRKMTGALWQSAFVAAAFALHPMHVESVAWITERKDVLSSMFWFLTMLAYVHYVYKPSVARYIITLIAFSLGLMSKPMLITLPFVLLLLDYWPLNKIRNPQSAIRNLLLEKIPFFILASVFTVITYLTQHGSGIAANIGVSPLKYRLANAFFSYAVYIGKLFWPCNMAVYYPFKTTGSVTLWQLVLYVFLLGGVSLLALRFWNTHRYLLVGWLWFLGTLIPVIGLVQITGSAYADRFTYISYIGLFIMLAWGLPEFLSKCPPFGETSLKAGPYRKFVLGISSAVVLTAFGIISYRQVGFWNNSITLFSHAVEVTHNNVLAYYNLGNACLDLGRYQDAMEAYKQAVRIKPDFKEAFFNLGDAYANLNRYQDAIEAYQQAIRIRPDYAEAYSNIGAVFCKLGRYQDAIEPFKQAIRIKPDLAEAHCNLGVIFANLGRYQDAIESYKQAVKVKPDFADAHFNLGVACLAAGDKDSALEEYKILKTLDAKQAEELYKLVNAI
jgi:tetratricopeptide (TPR) repeat protein